MKYVYSIVLVAFLALKLEDNIEIKGSVVF
jgi:hypothetical protein